MFEILPTDGGHALLASFMRAMEVSFHEPATWHSSPAAIFTFQMLRRSSAIVLASSHYLKNSCVLQIFPNMSNYTSHHRATSVGNQLLQNYRKFLASYEDWHQQDITPIQAAASFEVRLLGSISHVKAAEFLTVKWLRAEGCHDLLLSSRQCQCPQAIPSLIFPT